MAHWLLSEHGFKATKWYGAYNDLNGMPLPAESLLQIQREAIKAANASKEDEIKQLNYFLNNLQQNYHNLSNDSGDFFHNFLSRINSGYSMFDKDNKPKPKNPDFLNQYEKNLRDFVGYIAKCGNGEIPENIEQSLVGIVNRLGEDANFYAFKQRKADFWEEVTTWILSLAGFQNSFTTGAFVDKFGKQLIADNIAFLGDNIPTSTVQNGIFTIGFRVTEKDSQRDNVSLLQTIKDNLKDKCEDIRWGKNNWIDIDIKLTNLTGFQDLLNTINHEAKQKITVKLYDNLAESLSKGLTVQGKSGGKQNLFNNQKRNLIGADLLYSWDAYLGTLKGFYNTYNSISDALQIGGSGTLGTYVNWIFSKNIEKTVLGKNTLYMSSHGFSTLDKQMLEGNFYFSLSPTANSLKLLATVDSYSIQQNFSKN